MTSLSIIHREIIDDYCFVSAAALFITDSIFTSGQEWECIWMRNLSISTCLYLLNRYSTLVVVLAQILLTALGPEERISCNVASYFFYVFKIISLIVYAVFSSFRVWAIWGRRWIPFVIVLSAGLVAPCLNIYVFTHIQYVNIPMSSDPSGGCHFPWTLALHKARRLGVVSRISTICCDTLVLIATWAKTVGIKKLIDLKGSRTGIQLLLIRDGSLYFGCLFILNATTIFFDSFGEAYVNPLPAIADIMTSLLISRFILNLRSFSNVITDESLTSGAFSVSTFLGNIGAPLSFDDSPVALHQMINDPLTVGLLSEHGQIDYGDTEDGTTECSACP